MTKPLIVFDLDGTLIDSMPDLHHALSQTLKWLERPLIDLPTATSFVGNGAEVLVQRALDATGGASSVELATALTFFLDAYHRTGVTHTEIYPGVEETLRTLDAAGARLAVCTNKPQNLAEDVCKALDLHKSMALIVGASPERERKPSPASVNHVISSLGGSAARTIFVGDSEVDHATAAAAETAFVLFGGGYLNGVLPAPEPALRFDDWRDLKTDHLMALVD